MRVLFSAETSLSMTAFQSVVRLLAERGHDVVVAIHEEREASWRQSLLDGLVAGSPHVTVERAASPGPDRWLELAADVRSSLDLFQFLDPRFNETYLARALERAPRPAAALGRSPLGRHAASRRAVSAAFELIQRAVTTNAEIERYLLDRRPDVVLFTPYVGLRQIQPDFLRAAQALGLRTAICVKSWDNLTSKSLIRPQPDRLFVWNEIQRREAAELHGFPPERVVVTGAQCFDEWFTWVPRTREEFCARVGLDPGRPFLLYTCSVPWTGQSEVEFVRRWVAALREAGGGARGRRRARPAASEARPRLGRRRPLRPARGGRLPARCARADRPVLEGRLLRLDPPQRRRRRPEHERDDRGRDRGPLRAHRPRSRVRARPGRDAPLPVPARGRGRAAAGRPNAAGACGPGRGGAGRAGRRAGRAPQPSSPSSCGPTGSTCPRRRSSSTRSSASPRSPAPRPRRTPAPLLPLRPLLAPLATRAGRFATAAEG